MPFLTRDDAALRRLLADLPCAPEYQAALLYLEGNHWQGGAGWRGPQPAPTEAGAAETMAEIARAFVAKGASSEVAGRHVGGVAGKPVVWRWTVARPLDADGAPSAAEQALIDEADLLTSAWWDTQQVQGTFQTATRTLLATGRSPVRLFLPPGLLGDDGRVPPGDVATQLGRLVLEAVNPVTSAGVVTDAATRQKAGIATFTLDNQTYLELSTRDPAGNTVIRVTGPDTTQSITVPLNGALLICDLVRRPLLTPPLLSQQRLLDLAYTMLGRNVVMGGFLERILFNAQLPGEIEVDAQGRKTLTPDPFYFGAGSVNVIQGAEIRDERTGELRGFANPSIVYRDPVAVGTFLETRDAAYRAILEEAQQLHALISGDAGASGVSRQQALTDFLNSLMMTSPQIEHAVRWSVTTALHLAAYLAGQPGRYASLRVNATCQYHLGAVTPEELQALIALVEAEILSRETAMGRTGIDDTDAEARRIAAEREARTRLGTQVLASFDSGA